MKIFFSDKIRLFIIVITAFIITGLSSFFIADEALFGRTRVGQINQGFPFHYLETLYSHTIFLPFWFFANIVAYIIVIWSIWYLISLALQTNKWMGIMAAAILGVIALLINIHSNDSCVTGFPIQFYQICTIDETLPFIFVLFGCVFNFLFWFSLGSVIVALFHFSYSQRTIKPYLINRDILLTLESALVILVLFSMLGIIGRSDPSVIGEIISIIALIPLIFWLRGYVKANPNQGKKLFFSKVGYIMTGISLSLVAISTLFNLTYQPGWFNFTDLGFVFLSYPLSLFIHFQFDYNEASSRLVLYGIVFINLIVIVFLSDIVGFSISKIFKIIKKAN